MFPTNPNPALVPYTGNPSTASPSTGTTNPKPDPYTPSPSVNPLYSRPSLHVQVMMNYISASNSGRIPAPGEPDRAIDSLMSRLSSISLSNLPDQIKSQAPGIEDRYTEEKLASLVSYAAKLSIAEANETDREKEAQSNKLRCWTDGGRECVCCVPGGIMAGKLEHEKRVLCDMDCPRGCSDAEVAAAIGDTDWFHLGYCGVKGCWCMIFEDQMAEAAAQVCVGCGSGECVCGYEDLVDWDGVVDGTE